MPPHPRGRSRAPHKNGYAVTAHPPPHAILAARLFTGDALVHDHALVLNEGRVLDVVPQAALSPGMPAERLADHLLLAPGFLDVQVNGGGGVLFNDAPTVQTLRTMAAAHARFGTTALLPTLITDTPQAMRAAIAAVRHAQAEGVPGIAGLHLEGPFLAESRRGVHRVDYLRDPTEDDLALLCQPTPRPLLVTLAPERVTPAQIARLVEAGVVVSLGHTAARAELVQAALAQGARGFTHLFNAMPPLAGRDPGPVGAALASPGTYAGLIVDGHHVHPTSLIAALRAKSPERLMLVTDAMSSVGTDLTEFVLQGRRIRVAEGRLTTADGVLAGAHLDMASAVRNAVALLGVELTTALRMASAVPADFLGLRHSHGRLLPGRRADMVALVDDVRVEGVWIRGESQAFSQSAST
jgi:N-acetylglucosamine-6-phosphate deacetylase